MKSRVQSALLNRAVSFTLLAFAFGVLLAVFSTASPVALTCKDIPGPASTVAGAKPSRTAPSGGVREAWVARYSGPDYQDEARAIAIDSSGNVYVTGSSWGSGTFTDYATIKYNSVGQQQWVARYNGPGNFYDYPAAIVVDAAGNVYVTGGSSDSDLIGRYTTIKYNSAGQEQWIARYDGHGTTSGDFAVAIAVDPSGNVYVTGTSEDVDGTFDCATIKYNSAGQQRWVVRYGGPINVGSWAAAMVFDGAGNLYVTGTTVNANSGGDYATIKYNLDGQEQWVAFYDGAAGNPGNSDSAEAIAVDASGNVYVTGESQGSSTDLDYATVKYNSAGEEQWSARYVGPSDHDEAHAIGVDTLGNVYVTGFSYAVDSNYDYATVKYNSTGQQQWVTRYNGPGNLLDYANALAIDAAGNIYVTGISAPYDYATIKYSPAGEEQWVARYNGPGNDSDEARAIVVDVSGNVYVTGYSSAVSFDYDYATIKYTQSPTPTPTPGPTGRFNPTPGPRPTPAARPTP